MEVKLLNIYTYISMADSNMAPATMTAREQPIYILIWLLNPLQHRRVPLHSKQCLLPQLGPLFCGSCVRLCTDIYRDEYFV